MDNNSPNTNGAPKMWAVIAFMCGLAGGAFFGIALGARQADEQWATPYYTMEERLTEAVAALEQRDEIIDWSRERTAILESQNVTCAEALVSQQDDLIECRQSAANVADALIYWYIDAGVCRYGDDWIPDLEQLQR